jgi:hypothetical protein
LTLTNDDDVVKLLGKLEKESKALKHEALKFSWYMRGGLSYDDAMMLSYEDRKIISDIIKENLETTKDSGLPFF